MKNYSNYHSVNTNDKMTHDGILLLENSLNGFEGSDVIINNTTSSKVLIYQKYDAESTIKKVIGKIIDIELGNILEIDGLKWLVTTFPEDNKVYRKAEMQLCNYDLQVKISETKTLVGYDDYNAPVYNTVPEYTTLPAIIKNTVGSVDLNQAINLPSERTFITVKYDNVSMYIKEDDTFTLYRNYELQRRDYKVVGIDYSSVFGDKGIVTLIMERVVNT